MQKHFSIEKKRLDDIHQTSIETIHDRNNDNYVLRRWELKTQAQFLLPFKATSTMT